MAIFSKIEGLGKMRETGIVPLFYNEDIEVSKKILKACYDGGARVLEFTHRGDFAHEVFSALNKYAAKELPEMALGIGSVTDQAAASMYMMIGANFIVTPVFRDDIAIVCNRRKVLWSPGCGSLTEIARAEELGCDLVKLFPGGTYGPDFVKGILAPQPWTSIMPTGGVSPDEENLKAWFKAGVMCVGMGSKLISKSIIENEDYEGLSESVSKTISIIEKLKS